MEVITSKENKIVKLASGLIANKKIRDDNDMFIVEGIKTIEEISDDFEIVNVIVSDKLESSLKIDANKIVVSDNIYKGISDMKNPEGVMAIIKKKSYDLDILDNMSRVVMLDDIQDPGNLGTIIRTADAMGLDAVITSSDTCDLYNPKVTRSTMGSFFHMPIIGKQDKNQIIEVLKKKGYKIYSAALQTDTYLDDLDLTPDKIAIIIGNEAHGISSEILDKSDKVFKINMKGNAESLNASIAASIIMYEISRN